MVDLAGTSTMTIVAVVVVILAIVIFIICWTAKCSRDKKRAESDSHHHHVKAVAPPAQPPVEAKVEQKVAVKAAQPPATPRPQPQRVVGTTNIVQSTCGEGENCAEQAVAAQVEFRAPKQNVPPYVKSKLPPRRARPAVEQQVEVDVQPDIEVKAERPDNLKPRASKFTAKDDDEE